MSFKLKFIDSEGRFSPDYEKHLENYPNIKQSKVFRAFGENFFHDGIISDVKWNPSKGILELHMDAPNFGTPDEKCYLSVDFILSFYGVRNFQFKTAELFRDADNKAELTFLRAEFNTLNIVTEEKKISYVDNTFEENIGETEILLECIINDEVLVGFTFRDFDISPVDQALFYLVCKETNFNYRYFAN